MATSNQNPLAKYLDGPGIKQDEVAERLGVQGPALSKWKHGQVPPIRVLDVERETGVSRHDLRPDLYPMEATE